MINKEYWIWLSLALGQGAKTEEILSFYENPKIIYEQNRSERVYSGVFTPAQIKRLENTDISLSHDYLLKCEENSWAVITPDCPEYPEKLRNLQDFPLVLFCEGDITLMKSELCIGVVGTRNPITESVKITHQISSDLAKRGITIISGGALGVDSASHEGALSVNGKTVCVLGCGLGTRYLMSNDYLRNQIRQQGLIITEYPPFYPAGKTTFPLRNRIISGLSDGVLVVEAGEKSGSLITARYALEQGKDVFAVPGSVLSGSYTGTNKLIKDGAYITTEAGDIISFYSYTGQININEQNSENEEKEERFKAKRKTLPQNLSEDERKIIGALYSSPQHPDDLSVMCSLPVSKISSLLMMMEIKGIVKQTEGKNFELIL